MKSKTHVQNHKLLLLRFKSDKTYTNTAKVRGHHQHQQEKEYLLAGWWEFIRFRCQVGQIFQNGLQVGYLTQHVDLMILQTQHVWLTLLRVLVDSNYHHTH